MYGNSNQWYNGVIMNAAHNSGQSSKKQDDYLDELRAALAKIQKDDKIYEHIVNAPFINRLVTAKLGLGLIALVVLENDKKTIRGSALSNTQSDLGAIEMTSERFEDMQIPLHDPENLVAKALRNGHSQETNDWYYLFAPVFSADQARFVQAGLGIASSVIYPLVHSAQGGALVFSYFKPLKDIGHEQHEFMKSYCALAASTITASGN